MFDILCELTLRRFNYFEGRGLLEFKKINNQILALTQESKDSLERLVHG